MTKFLTELFKLFPFLGVLIPPVEPDAPHELIVRWRLIVFVLGGAMGGIVVAMAWALFLSTSFKYVTAQEVDEKVAAAATQILKPITEEQRLQRELLTDFTDKLNDTLAANLSAQMRLYAGKRCKADTSQEREQWTREMEKLQEEYLKIKKRPYAVPTCDQL